MRRNAALAIAALQKAALSANCEFTILLILQVQRMAGLTDRTAAWPRVGESPLRAVRDGVSWIDLRECCEAENGGNEPILLIAAAQLR